MKENIIDFIRDEWIGFLKYMARRCAYCNVKIPKGKGYVAYSSFNRLCEECFSDSSSNKLNDSELEKI